MIFIEEFLFRFASCGNYMLFTIWYKLVDLLLLFLATHSSVLAWRIQGQGSLVGCRLWGHTESDTTEVTQQQQQPFLDSFIETQFTYHTVHPLCTIQWILGHSQNCTAIISFNISHFSSPQKEIPYPLVITPDFSANLPVISSH